MAQRYNPRATKKSGHALRRRTRSSESTRQACRKSHSSSSGNIGMPLMATSADRITTASFAGVIRGAMPGNTETMPAC
eukprot:CAMPEP_0117576726 /NCGR_PEP_ID=MMETSP0784-20121206/62978_1 /TAXON_ID=39447 /ORGANISM="" /LENGTH=77 /DNA_ID=CAMNT_0005376051 /DNA_START=744 /DNA_END=974 /DNA_ORIENTATION=-